MLSVPLVVLLELPPLAFGPALPPPAFAAPQELRRPTGVRAGLEPLRLLEARGTGNPPLDLARLKPEPPRALVNPVVDGLLVLMALSATHGGWDDRTWSTRSWAALGAVTPVLVPPVAPPPRP